MKQLLNIAAFAAIILAVPSCVYPFEPDIKGEDSRLVVEGDIHVGSTSTFTFSRVYPLDSDDYTPPQLRISGYIEGEDGMRVEQTGANDPYSPYYYSSYPSDMLYFDTTDLPSGQKYRLHFEDAGSGAVFESDWLEVCPPPAIDDLTYILDWDREELNVALSMHCNGRSHFRWYYTEEWEYHTDAYAHYYYDPELDRIYEFPALENNYYCWTRYNSPNIKIFSTADQVEDRFVDLEFHRVSRSETRLQIMYHIIVYLEAMEENAYKYWENIRENSQGQGTIFSPTPSQMTGNIHCVSDPSIPVIGYISAAMQASADMYYDNAEERFYKTPLPTKYEVLELSKDFAKYYYMGYAPLDILPSDNAPVYQWAPRRCVDCRLMGGTKNKPAGWPNEHR
jgi:hypothetical protein